MKASRSTRTKKKQKKSALSDKRLKLAKRLGLDPSAKPAKPATLTEEEKRRFIPSDLYWKYRTAWEILQKEGVSCRVIEKEKQLHLMDIERLKNAVLVCNKLLEQQNNAAQLAENEYNEVVKEIEAAIGMSLKNTEICPDTFEVRSGD